MVIKTVDSFFDNGQRSTVDSRVVVGTGLASILCTCLPAAVGTIFCQRSTVDCRQPGRCGDGFSIPILMRFLVIDYNVLWSVDRQPLTKKLICKDKIPRTDQVHDHQG